MLTFKVMLREWKQACGSRKLVLPAALAGVLVALAAAPTIVVGQLQQLGEEPRVAADVFHARRPEPIPVVVGADSHVINAGDAHRVLVVPLENRTGDSSLDALGAWATDWITQRLSVVDNIEVLDGAVDGADGAAVEWAEARVMELGRRSRAEATVLGAYYRSGDSIRFQVRIRNDQGASVSGGVSPVSAHAERPENAVREVGERVAGAVAAAANRPLRAPACRASSAARRRRATLAAPQGGCRAAPAM